MDERLAKQFYENNVLDRIKIAEDNIALLQKATAVSTVTDIGGEIFTAAGQLIVGIGVGLANALNPPSAEGQILMGRLGLTEQMQWENLSIIAGNGLIESAGVLSVGAGTLITVGTDTVGITPGANYQFIGTGAGTDASWINLSTLAGAGMTHTAGVLNVIAGNGITVAADSVALTTPGTLTVSSSNNAAGSHTHAITTSSNPGAAASILASDASGFLTLLKLNVDTIADKSGANLTLSPAGDIVFDPTGNDLLPNTGYDLNVGSLAKKYLSLHVAELWAETLVAQNTLATIGGRVLVGPTTILTSDLAPADTTLYSKYNNLASGDRVYLEANGNVEFIAITGAPGGAGPYSYTITRNLDGSGANQWYAGDAVFNTGAAGDGFIDLYSTRGVASASEVGPTIVGNIRNSATYNDWAESWAIGNLNGLYGYGVDTYGAAFGKYAAGTPHITIDATNGYRIFSGLSTIIGQWDNSGNITIGAVATEHISISPTAVQIKDGATVYTNLTAGALTIGEVGASKDNIYIAAGALSIRNNTTERIGLTAAGILTIKDSAGAAVITLNASAGAEITKKLTMPGASSAIAIGATPPTSATVGTGIWIDRTGMYGLAANVQQAIFDATTGDIKAGAGAVVIDENGITISESDSILASNSLNFSTSGGANGGRITYTTPLLSTTKYLIFRGSGQAGYDHETTIDAYAATSKFALIRLKAYYDASNYAELRISAASGSGVISINHAGLSIDYGLTFANDNLYDIGASGATRPRDYFGGRHGYFAGAINAGTANGTGTGDVGHSGDLKAYKNSTSYTGYAYVPLETQQTSTAWDGDARSTTAKTLIDLSAVFGAPAGIKAVKMSVSIRDSGSAGGDYYMFLWHNNVALTGVPIRCSGLANDSYTSVQVDVPCDANGDIYYQIGASGAGTMDVFMTIQGYYI